MASIDVLRDLWNRVDTPVNASFNMNSGQLLCSMCNILAKEGYGGGNTPFQCWLLAYLSITGGSNLWNARAAAEFRIPVKIGDEYPGCTVEAFEESEREVEKELEDLYYRGFLTRDEGVYRIKP